MTTPDVDDALLALRRGQAAQHELKVSAELLVDLGQQVDNRIFGKLLRNEAISPEEAVQAWYEKYSYHRLSKKLTNVTRKGQTAAERVGHAFEMNNPSSV